MKKMKFTYWLIGLGCGITLSGIAGAIVSLKIEANSYSSQIVNSQSISSEVMQSYNYSNDLPENKEEPIEEKSEETVSEGTTELTYCQIFIPEQSGASEICKILEQNEIVKDGNEFLNYIRKYKKQTYLKTGTLTLPIEAEYEVLLKCLLA